MTDEVHKRDISESVQLKSPARYGDLDLYINGDINERHYGDVTMGTVASQITSLNIVYSTVYSGADQRNTKAPRHWPLCGEFTGTGEFPAQRASNAENVSIWRRHHEIGSTFLTLYITPFCLDLFISLKVVLFILPLTSSWTLIGLDEINFTKEQIVRSYSFQTTYFNCHERLDKDITGNISNLKIENTNIQRITPLTVLHSRFKKHHTNILYLKMATS